MKILPFLLSSALSVALMAGAASTASTASAASMTVTKTPNGGAIVYLSGDIVNGDKDQFAKLTLPASHIVIALNGHGGHAYEGIAIGEAVYAHGYSTWVGGFTGKQECESACAYIWLAGKVRYVAPGAFIGFHGVSNTLGEAGSASNASVGAYMSRLGLNDQAIIWATEKVGEHINWLTPAKARDLDIQFSWFPESSKVSLIN
jgi:hypothetical protein